MTSQDSDQQITWRTSVRVWWSFLWRWMLFIATISIVVTILSRLIGLDPVFARLTPILLSAPASILAIKQSLEVHLNILQV